MQVSFDRFGPEKVIEVYNARVGLKGFIVIDNTALGPGKGGIRMTPSVSIEEVSRLARAMTWKNALANLPFGGAKAGIVADDKTISPKKKQELVAAFALAVKEFVPKVYVAGPDMNTTEKEMSTFAKTLKSKKAATGKPSRDGGLPHELGSTGFGVFHATRVALSHKNIPLKNATIAIEGFGNVGMFAASFLSRAGAKIIAVSDSHGVLYDKKGININKLKQVKKSKGSVIKYSSKKPLPSEDIIGVSADVLVTAAIPDLVKIGDVQKIKAKIIVQGSNIPMSIEVEEALARKGVLVIPDFVANAGGVISSYVEFIGSSKKKMFSLVEKKIEENTFLVLKHAVDNNVIPRVAAMHIAQDRVLRKCDTCSI